MAAAVKGKAFDLKRALVETYAVNERTNQYLLENLDDRAWRAEAPGGKGRTIAAIVAHMHNVRHMWLAVCAKEMQIPDKLERDSCTRKQAMAALAKSAECCSKLIADALE